MKECSLCRLIKPLSDFFHYRDGKPYHCCKSCNAARRRQWRRSLPGHVRSEANRRDKLKTRYKMTPDDYERMSEAQGHVCNVCKRPESAIDRQTGRVKNLAVDHNHDCCPGETSCGNCVRQLLCMACNTEFELLERLGDLCRTV